MNTTHLLLARHEKAFIPADEVVQYYSPHSSLPKLLRKVADGHIKLPLICTEDSQKSTRGVCISDMAAYLDERREMAKSVSGNSLNHWNRL